MKLLKLPIAAAVLCLLNSATAATFSINPNERFQTIEGWGTCMIYWSTGSTPYYNEAWRQAYRDLGCNILRVDMAREVLIHSSGNHATPVPLEDNLDANVAKMDFKIQYASVYGDMAKWLAVNALEPERIKIVGSFWSPPHWMKGPTGFSTYHVSNTGVSKPTPWLANGTSGDSIGGRLLQTPENLEQFGRFVAAWLAGWEKEYGIPMYAISLQNESTFENPFDSCTYLLDQNGQEDWTQYANALYAVREAFRRYGVSAKIKGPHVASPGPNNTNPHTLRRQMGMIDGVKKHSDPTLINFLSYYGSNGYMDRGEGGARAWAGYWLGASTVGGNWGWLQSSVNSVVYGLKNDGKPTWASETGDSGTTWPGAMNTAIKMQEALAYGNVAAYIYWQFSDTSNTENESNLLGKNNINNPHNSKKYCAYKHFSRYVRPGAIRIGGSFESGYPATGGSNGYDTLNSVNASAYYHPDDKQLTVVLINMKTTEESVTINIPSGLTVHTLNAYRTKSNEGFASISPVSFPNGTATLSLPGQSIVTLTGPASTELDAGDTDADGIPDILETYFGMNPDIPDSEKWHSSVSRSGQTWHFDYAVAADFEGTLPVLQWSNDLIGWQTSGLSQPTLSGETPDGRKLLRSSLTNNEAENVFFRFMLE